jgi:histidinol-phosphate phosphatase family protein
LDRDGVLNELRIDPEQGTIDSPLHPSQVRILPGVPQALARLEALGFTLTLISNQPAAAKGKTTRENLDLAHAEVVRLAQAAGAHIQASYICFHKAEDRCLCRKPGVGLLEKAFHDHPNATRETSWMIGDGVSDIQAGQTFGLKTALVATHKCDTCQVLLNTAVDPTLWIKDLPEFAERMATVFKSISSNR